MKNFLIIITVMFVSNIGNEELSKKSSEKALIRELMKRYESVGVSGRPVNDSRKKIKINYGLALIQILGLDANTQILRTNCWIRYKWYDELLSWNKKEYNEIEQVRVSRDHIWIPDIQLFNFADERMKVTREARIVVYNTGDILWIPQALFKSSCSVEIIYFPFDVQICRLDFGSWVYDTTQLELLWWTIDDFPNKSMPFVDFDNYILNNEWHTDGELDKNENQKDISKKKQIKSIRFIRQQNFTDGNRTITKSFHVLRYRIRLRRNPSFYVFILILPCVLLSLLVNIVFWLPPESPAKILLGMNIFVSFFILLLLLKSSIPTAVRTFPLIGSFFCLNMIMITVSTFLVTIVVNFYVRGDRKGPMPNYVRKIMIEGIGRLLYVSQFVPLPPPRPNTNEKVFKTPSPGKRLTHKFHVSELASNKFATPIPQIETISTSHYLNRPNISNVSYSQTDMVPSVRNENHPQLRNNTHVLNSNKKFNGGIHSPVNAAITGKSSVEKNVAEISSYVKKYIDKQKEAQRKNLLTMEWRTLGLVLDRLFCIFYFSTIIISVIIAIPTKDEIMQMEEELVDPNMIFA